MGEGQDQHITDGRFSHREQKHEVTLIADIGPNIEWLLRETPLIESQNIEPLPAGSDAPEDWKRLTAKVNMDKETLWWVYAMNDQIHLHAPQEWVKEIKQKVKNLARFYK